MDQPQVLPPTREDIAMERQLRIQSDMQRVKTPILMARIVIWILIVLNLAGIILSIHLFFQQHTWWDELSATTQRNYLIAGAISIMVPLLLLVIALLLRQNMRVVAQLQFIELRLDEAVDGAVFRWATGGDYTTFRRQKGSFFPIADALKDERAEELQALDTIADSIELMLEQLDGKEARIKTLIQYRGLMQAYVRIIDEMTERQTKLDNPQTLRAEAEQLQEKLRKVVAANSLPAEQEKQRRTLFGSAFLYLKYIRKRERRAKQIARLKGQT